MKKFKYLGFAFALLLASGCASISQAGPFLTDISSNGNGKIKEQKCMMVLSTISPPAPILNNSDCRQSEIDLK